MLGGIMRCDTIATGIIDALNSMSKYALLPASFPPLFPPNFSFPSPIIFSSLIPSLLFPPYFSFPHTSPFHATPYRFAPSYTVPYHNIDFIHRCYLLWVTFFGSWILIFTNSRTNACFKSPLPSLLPYFILNFSHSYSLFFLNPLLFSHFIFSFF